MNIQQLREAMASDATRENSELKKEIAELKESLARLSEEKEDIKLRLESDCKALSNRCFVLSKGSFCIFCELSGYHCEHEVSLDEKIKIAKQFMEK